MQLKRSSTAEEFIKGIIPNFFYYIFLLFNMMATPFGKLSLFFHKLFKTKTGLKVLEAEKMIDNLKGMVEELKTIKKYNNKNGGFYLGDTNEGKDKKTLH